MSDVIRFATVLQSTDPDRRKGAAAGARVIAMTVMDLCLNPDLVPAAKVYFEEQTAENRYTPLLGPQDPPATYPNTEKMGAVGEAIRPFWYDPERCDTYPEQLGTEYPTAGARAAEN